MIDESLKLSIEDMIYKQSTMTLEDIIKTYGYKLTLRRDGSEQYVKE